MKSAQYCTSLDKFFALILGVYICVWTGYVHGQTLLKNQTEVRSQAEVNSQAEASNQGEASSQGSGLVGNGLGALYDFDIPAQSLESALLLLSAQANLDVLTSSEAASHWTSRPVIGRMSVTSALNVLLEGTRLQYKISQGTIVVMATVPTPAPEIIRPFKGIEEVLVTATKRATDLQKTPIAVTALSQADLDRNQVKDIRDLTGLVPGLEMTNTGEQSALLIQLRGIGQTNITEIADGPVALHINGVYSPRSQGAATLLYDIDSVEVLRGPQGTLFGRNSTSGNINIQTRQPQLGVLTADTALSLGDWGRKALKGTINIPMSEKFAIRIAGALDKHDAYTRLINNYAGLGPQYPASIADLNEFQKADSNAQGPDADDQRAVRLSTLWQPDVNLNWVTNMEHYSDEGTSVTELDPTLVERGKRVTVSDTPGYVDLTNDSLRSRIDYTFADEKTFSYLLGSAVMRRKQAFDQDMGRSGNYEERRTDSSTFKFISHEFQLVNSDDSPLRWIIGGFYSHERNSIVYAIDQADNDGGGNRDKITSFISYDPGAAVAFFVQPDRRVHSKAIFTQETVDINQSNRFTAGVRFTEDTKSDRGGRSINCRVTGVGPYLEPDSIDSGAPSAQEIFTDAGVLAAIKSGQPYDNGSYEGIGNQPCWVRQVNDYSATWKNTSGLLRYEHDLTKDVMTYASVATGFKSGHIQDRGNEAKPEEVINYELGLKSTLLDGNMRLNAAVYQADYTNLQFSDRDLFDTNGDGVVDRITSTVVRNAAEATVKGLELEVDWALTAKDYVQIAAAFMDATFNDFQTPDTLFGNLFNPYARGELAEAEKIVNLSGNSPVRAPDWKFTFVYKHDFAIAKGVLTPKIKATFSDKYFLDIYNRTELSPGVFKSAPNGVKNLAVQKAYQTFDLSLNYAPGENDWGIEAYIRNATNENIKTSSGTFITPSGFDAIYLPPRTAGVTFNYKFK